MGKNKGKYLDCDPLKTLVTDWKKKKPCSARDEALVVTITKYAISCGVNKTRK